MKHTTNTSRDRAISIGLSLLMVLSVFAIAIGTVPIGVQANGVTDHPVRDYQFETIEDGTAQWAVLSGENRAKLTAVNSTGGLGDEGTLVVPASAVGIETLGDLQTLSWEVTDGTGYSPHVDVIVSTDGDETADDALVFEYAKVRPPLGCDDLEDVPADGSDYNTFADKGIINDTAVAWLASGDPGPCFETTETNYTAATLAEWQDGGVVRDGTDGEIVPIDENTTVLRLEIEVDNWIEDSTAEVDAITANGQRYYDSIQDAENAATDGDTVTVGDGTYEEEIAVDTPNVTIQEGSTAIVQGRFDITADGVTVTGIEVGHFTTSTSPTGNDAIFIAASDVTIDGVTIANVTGVGPGVEVEGVHIFSDTAENILITGVTIDDIYSEYAGADGIKVQYSPTGVTVEDTSFDNIEGWWSYGISVTQTGGDPGQVPQDVDINSNAFGSITAHAQPGGDESPALWGVGVGIDAAVSGGEFVNSADATQVLIEFNDFALSSMDVGVLNKDDAAVESTLNFWETERGPSTGTIDPADFANSVAGGVVGPVTYDPFLTAPQAEVNHDPAETQQFAHDLDVAAGIGPIGVPGATETTVLEMFDENQNGELDDLGEAAIYAYDASSDTWELADPNATLGALDALIVASPDGGRAVIDLADANTPMPPGEGDAFEGWNLMSAPFYGTTDSAFGAGSADAERVVHLYDQPGSQPYGDGAAPIRTHDIESGEGFDTDAYAGYWVYVDQDGTIAAVVPAGVSADDERDLIAPAT